MSLWKGRIEITDISKTFDIGYHLLTMSLCSDISKGCQKVLKVLFGVLFFRNDVPPAMDIFGSLQCQENSRFSKLATNCYHYPLGKCAKESRWLPKHKIFNLKPSWKR